MAEMIRKVYEVDRMICPDSEASCRTAKRCPKCGGTMKVVDFITEYAAVDRIIGHLKLTFLVEKRLPSHVIEQVALTRPPHEGLRNAALMAAASACTPGDRLCLLECGRGAGRVFLRIGDFERDEKSIVLWSILWSFGTIICPNGEKWSCSSFLTSIRGGEYLL